MASASKNAMTATARTWTPVAPTAAEQPAVMAGFKGTRSVTMAIRPTTMPVEPIALQPLAATAFVGSTGLRAKRTLRPATMAMKTMTTGAPMNVSGTTPAPGARAMWQQTLAIWRARRDHRLPRQSDAQSEKQKEKYRGVCGSVGSVG